MIGILGGTFDPVHFGHLRPALEIRQALGLDEIRLLPARMPPHREQPVASPEQRLAMLQAAIIGHDDFVIDTRELERPGPSYMIDTLQSLRDEFSSRTLCLLLGVDAYAGLASWRRWRELHDYCHMVVMMRPGTEVPQTGVTGEFTRRHRAAKPGMLRQQSSGLVCLQTVSQLEISATAIRALIARGEDASFLLPDRVLGYIHEHNLYTTRQEHEQGERTTG